ncbi:unnamed protein product [Ceutorhynchus assimilis]|uniref:Uncharacterized protein n=1 Tax=Ceutorhynchus assimilis TaxID=467358 RepID=A0A9N9MJI1_9CUCU|nr:unnamed protein product [Ceutorhynchus assimilis]
MVSFDYDETKEEIPESALAKQQNTMDECKTIQVVVEKLVSWHSTPISDQRREDYFRFRAQILMEEARRAQGDYFIAEPNPLNPTPTDAGLFLLPILFEKGLEESKFEKIGEKRQDFLMNWFGACFEKEMENVDIDNLKNVNVGIQAT